MGAVRFKWPLARSQCELLKSFEHRTKEIYDAFTLYKHQIPTCGAALLNPSMTKVALAQSLSRPRSHHAPARRCRAVATDSAQTVRSNAARSRAQHGDEARSAQDPAILWGRPGWIKTNRSRC